MAGAPETPGARPTAEALLLALAVDLIEGGAGGERALLERAEELRLQIANPGEDVAGPRREDRAWRVVDLVRELAVDESADLASRRQAWRLLLVPLDQWVAAAGEPTPPSRPETRVPGHNLVAGPDGVAADELRRVERAIAKAGEPSAWDLRAPVVLWGGVALGVVGLVLIALTSQWSFFWLVLLGAAGAFAGARLRRTGRERAAKTESDLRELAAQVDRATHRAAAEYTDARSAYAVKVEMLVTYRALRRQVG